MGQEEKGSSKIKMEEVQIIIYLHPKILLGLGPINSDFVDLGWGGYHAYLPIQALFFNSSS